MTHSCPYCQKDCHVFKGNYISIHKQNGQRCPGSQWRLTQDFTCHLKWRADNWGKLHGIDYKQIYQDWTATVRVRHAIIDQIINCDCWVCRSPV